MANWLTQYANPETGGFGLQWYNRAKGQGLTPTQIAGAVPGSGMPMGWRARDAMAADLSQIGQQAAQAANLQQQIRGYEGQLGSYRSQLDDYTRQVNAITGQYQTALGDVNRLTGEVQDWTGKFQESQSAYEAAKAQADAYKEEAVGRQLSGLRTGATGAGGGGSSYDPYGLATGEPRYRTGSPAEENLVSVKQEVDPTDSVLSQKGPVVHAIRAGTAGGSSSQESRAPVKSGNGSYYASRFG